MLALPAGAEAGNVVEAGDMVETGDAVEACGAVEASNAMVMRRTFGGGHCWQPISCFVHIH